MEGFLEDFRRHLDDGWIDRLTQEVSKGRGRESLGEAWHLIKALQLAPQMLTAIRMGNEPPSPWLMPILGMSTYVISVAASLPKAETIFAELTNLASKGDAENFSRFFDKLFEVETAVYFSTMQGQATARFETAAHPDLWIQPHGSQHPRETPVECKRISPLGPKKQSFRRLRKRLKVAVGQLGESLQGHDSGVVAMRIRPPASAEELLEVDETIRRRMNNPRVGFVELFWNEGETTTGQWLFDPSNRPVRSRKEAYRLIPYRIRNSGATRQLTPHDSRASLLGARVPQRPSDSV